MRNTAGIVEETSTDYPSKTPGFTPVVLGVGQVHARCFGGGSGSRPLFWGCVVFLILLVFCLVLCRFLFLFAGLLPFYFVLNVVSG